MEIDEAKREFPKLDWGTIVRERWFAQPENTIGGWCITLDRIDGTPADGNPTIATFLDEDAAKHMARIHNDWIEFIRSVRDGKEAPCANCSAQSPNAERPDPGE